MAWRDILRRFPESTGSWLCKWFLTILLVSIWLIALGATVIPGVYGIVAVVVGLVSLTLTVLMRDDVSCMWRPRQ